MEVDGAAGDGEAKADAADGAAPVAVDSEEGLEDRFEKRVGDTRTVVANGDGRGLVGEVEGDR
jgi:hypothetical protein